MRNKSGEPAKANPSLDEMISHKHSSVVDGDKRIVENTLRVLFNEYNARHQDSMFNNQRYHRQLNYLQLYVLVMVYLASLILSKPSSSELFGIKLPTNISLGVTWPIYVLASAIAYFIIANLMDALYMTFSNNARIEHIEKQVNLLLGSNIMIWEHQVTRFLFSVSPYMKKPLVRPYYLVGLWSIILFTCLQYILIRICFITESRLFSNIYMVIIIALSLYHVCVWFYATSKWKNDVFKVSQGVTPSHAENH